MTLHGLLVRSTASEAGSVLPLPAKDAAVKALDAATGQSAQHAVIVLRDGDKPTTRQRFSTPLALSVHQAKGLEHPHALLVDLVSGRRQVDAEEGDGVTAAELEVEELDDLRTRGKADRSLERFTRSASTRFMSR